MQLLFSINGDVQDKLSEPTPLIVAASLQCVRTYYAFIMLCNVQIMFVSLQIKIETKHQYNLKLLKHCPTPIYLIEFDVHCCHKVVWNHVRQYNTR